MKIKILVLFTLLFNSHITVAEEVTEMEGTSLIGNRELPKVLYIVPWKKSQLPDMESLPIDRLVDDALAPINRIEFQRQVNFHDLLNSDNNDNTETDY